jgi:hypothetical protein
MAAGANRAAARGAGDRRRATRRAKWRRVGGRRAKCRLLGVGDHGCGTELLYRNSGGCFAAVAMRDQRRALGGLWRRRKDNCGDLKTGNFLGRYDLVLCQRKESGREPARQGENVVCRPGTGEAGGLEGRGECSCTTIPGCPAADGFLLMLLQFDHSSSDSTTAEKKRSRADSAGKREDDDRPKTREDSNRVLSRVRFVPLPVRLWRL